jgi:hypothetical protein
MTRERVAKIVNVLAAFALGVLLGINTQIIHYNDGGEALVVIFFGQEIVLIDEAAEARKREYGQGQP